MGRALTPQTNIISLRKEAKRWLKALRAGDAKATARFAAAWPDAPAEPGLRHIQHALALDHGCESWIALKAAIEELALAGKTRAARVDQVLRHGWDGDLSLARRLLRLEPGLARENLFTGAACGDLATVERRLARNPEDARAAGGTLNWTALAYVAYSRLDSVNAVAIAQRLLEAGADPNFQFDDGWGNSFKVVTGAIRLGEGAKPSHPQAGELVELLIAAGADPFDFQALYDISIVGKDTHWYEVLWRHCEAQGIADGWRDPAAGRPGGTLAMSTLNYLLGNAVAQNHLARAEWLLVRGADPDTPHAYTGQPVHALAQLSGFIEMVVLLERHGSRLSPLKGVQAFQAACLRVDEPAARVLLAADPAMLDDPAPLIAAAEFGNAPAVALLLSLGASALNLGEDGISPLHRAAQAGSLDAVDLLIAAGADVDLHERRWKGTPLSWSVVMGNPHVAERMAPLSHDVRTLAYMGRLERLEAVLRAAPGMSNLRLPDEVAPTPLFCLPDDPDLAVDVARILLAHGADPTLRDGKGCSAIDVAREHDFDAAADLMEAGIPRISTPR